MGRKQLILMPDGQMNQMGAQAFTQMKQQTPVDTNPATKNYIQCIVDALNVVAKDQAHVAHWDVAVFKDPSVNAFALPGGKIGVNTGILPVAKTDAQLATVLGHEMGHVIARHGAERVSQQAGTQLGLTALGAITPDNPQKDTLMGLLGMGAQVGVLLPFSRTQESEADLIGQRLMAQAGFDPQQTVQLWHNMSAASGGKAPPQFLSTHPADQTRIQALQDHMAEAEADYRHALATGRSPHCQRP